MNKAKININAASLIVIPSGRDYERCLQAFEREFGVIAPRFEDRRLTQVSPSGQTYKKVKGKDVPAYIASGLADIGLTGTDSCEEQIPDNSDLLYRPIGSPMCTFSLLLPDDRIMARALVARLTSAKADPVHVATSYPCFLQRCIKRAQAAGQILNLKLDPFTPSGSVEALVGWKVEAVADIVESGATAAANGLRKGPELADVSPAIVWRSPGRPPEILYDKP